MNELFDLALADNGRGVLFTKASPIHGYGLFTNDDLPANTILCRRLGLRSVLSFRDKRAIIGIDGLDPAIPEDVIFKKINHSCHPNAFLNDTGCLINIEKLKNEEEITIDYCNLLYDTPWQAACLCGQPNCRGIIKSND
ncbi:SET domain-containing protein-lysine N-methyltransferase [Mucilaginibacter jinjuensis]|uniref:SET domain-containing protein n=1 Tax=Mucilaginibacter jinjuensis TaxID=1176721 RepID=A0ABY7TEG8_9SPHI|nr:SET domain-containing protein-lysine N-methyltransferase [Mucilaginibacter jinjuensis]WCT14925.1 hypothetical protein PQO05_13360 [Mucilaginibacter jinjuensis]